MERVYSVVEYLIVSPTLEQIDVNLTSVLEVRLDACEGSRCVWMEVADGTDTDC